MKLILLFISLVFHSGLAIVAQPFGVGQVSISFTDSSRNNRSVPVEILYPADSTGLMTPITSQVSDAFPVLSFGHGFLMTWESYLNIGSIVVPAGYIIILPKTEGTISPSHEAFGLDLSFVISEMNRLNTDSSSLFFQRIDTMNCVMGHSMGGGSAFLAAAGNPSIKSIATLAAAETNPSAIDAASTLNIPALVIAAENDCVTPPAGNQIPMYDSLQSTCKYYVSIIGGSHCQMADPNFFCSIGEATCTPAPTINRATQHDVIARYLLPWLDYVLKFNCGSSNELDSLFVQDTTISSLKNCPACSTTGKYEINIEQAVIYPNPFNDKFSITLPYSAEHEVNLKIYSMEGVVVKAQSLKNIQNEIYFPHSLPPAVYLLMLEINGAVIKQKLLKM